MQLRPLTSLEKKSCFYDLSGVPNTRGLPVKLKKMNFAVIQRHFLF